MGNRRGMLPLLLTGSILDAVVPFSLFLLTGLLYAVGATHQIIALIGGVVAGSFIFNALGIFLSRHGKRAGLILLAFATTVAALYAYRIRAFPVMDLTMVFSASLLNMSVCTLTSYSLSRMAMRVRGSGISILHTVSLGFGDMAVFLAILVSYILLGYSNLPLMVILSVVAAFASSSVMLDYSMKRMGGRKVPDA